MNVKFKRNLLAGLCIPALTIAMTASAYATDAKTNAHATGTSTGAMGSSDAMKSTRDMRASKLIGSEVKNAQGENLGEIKDLVIDVKHGRVHYAILSFGGFLGMGDKLFAFPVGLFHQAADGDKVILNADKSQLKAAPGFEAQYYPDWNAPKYKADVDRHFGPKFALKSMPNQQLRRASELMDKDVNDRNGKDVGEIEDLVVNLGEGSVHYALLEFDQSWNLKDKLLAFPLSAFTFTGKDKSLVLNVDRSKLDTKRAFDKKNWPDINDPKYVGDVDRYLIVVVPASSMKTAQSADKAKK